MQNLLDIKKALVKAPDELLEKLWFGLGEGAENEMSLIAPEGTEKYEFPQVWELVGKEYPEILELNKLIQNVASAQVILDKGDNAADHISEKYWEDGVSDNDTFEEK